MSFQVWKVVNVQQQNNNLVLFSHLSRHFTLIWIFFFFCLYSKITYKEIKKFRRFQAQWNETEVRRRQKWSSRAVTGEYKLETVKRGRSEVRRRETERGGEKRLSQVDAVSSPWVNVTGSDDKMLLHIFTFSSYYWFAEKRQIAETTVQHIQTSTRFNKTWSAATGAPL